MTTMNNEGPADPSAHERAAARTALPKPYATLHTDDGYFTRTERDDGWCRVLRVEVYTADQMRDYAAAAVAAERDRYAEAER